MKKEVNKESFGKKLNKDSIIFGIALLLIGIIIGICLNLGDTFALETSASLDAATASNATSSNATSSNATSSNATSSNATSSNATSSNASSHDNTLFLNDYSFQDVEVKAGQSVMFNYSTSGACNTSAVLYFVKDGDLSNEIAFSSTIENVDNPFFEIPANVTTGKYLLAEILLFGLNSDGSIFSKYYSSINQNADYFVEFTNKYINVLNDNTSVVELNNISISSTNVVPGEKVNLELLTSSGLRTAKLIFKTDSGNRFSVYVSDILGKPYFMVPSIVNPDDYSLYQVILTSDDNTSTYTKDDNLKYDISINIAEGDEELYVYNNGEINEDIIKKIYKAESGTEIYVDANDNSIISEDVFNAIKGSSKNLNISYGDNYIVFCGNEITNPKSIDAKIVVDILSNDEKINKLIDNGFVINFSSNGNLPGNALVRVKVTEEMKNNFGNDNVSVYYYNEDKNGFCVIDAKVKENNGYYEFNISHNSKYVLVNKKLDKKLIVEDDSNIVDFQLGNKMYLLMIAGGVLLIIVAILIVLKSKKKNKEKN